MRQLLKRALPANLRFFLRWENYRDLCFFSGFCFKRFAFSLSSRSVTLPLRQSVPTVHSGIIFNHTKNHQLAEVFTLAGIGFVQGRHCLYVSDDRDIQTVAPGLASRYPARIALKFLKSIEISRDGTPSYTSRKIAPATNYISMLAVGTVLEKVVISNTLSVFDCAPRVYDLIRFPAEDFFIYALVVEHVDGEIVHGESGLLFMAAFEKILKKLHIERVAVKRSKDFQPPEFNRNIIACSNGARKYIDIQNFAIFSSGVNCPASIIKKFAPKYIGSESNRCTGKVLSRSERKVVNRKIVRFAKWFESLLAANGFSFDEATVIDAGRPPGLYAISSLSLGACWSYIVDCRKDFADLRLFLFRHGFSRFSQLEVPSEGDRQAAMEVDLVCCSLEDDRDYMDRLFSFTHMEYLFIDYPVSESRRMEKAMKRKEMPGEAGRCFINLDTVVRNRRTYRVFKRQDTDQCG